MPFQLPPTQPKRFTLLDAAEVVPVTDLSEMLTASFETEVCGDASAYPVTCGIDVDVVKQLSDAFNVNSGLPYHVVAGFECAPVGLSEATFRQRSLELLEKGYSKVIESEWACPTIEPDNPGLTLDPASLDVLTTDPVSILGAFSLAETYIAQNFPGEAMIHLPVGLQPYACEAGLVVINGSSFRTKLGNRVVFGAGYPGSAPGECGTAPADGTSWVYVTGVPTFFVSPVNTIPGTFQEAFDTTRNKVAFISERLVLPAVNDCGHAAIQAMLPC